MKIKVTLPDGTIREISGKPGDSVMESMRSGGIPVRADCGGAMACATCHIHLDPAWLAKLGPAMDEEGDLLDLSDYRTDASRLSCQMKVSEALDGLAFSLQLDAYEG